MVEWNKSGRDCRGKQIGALRVLEERQQKMFINIRTFMVQRGKIIEAIPVTFGE